MISITPTTPRANNSALSFLPYMPFDPAWIEQSSAFTHSDARMGNAALRLLFAAWRGQPAGTIPSSHSFIASATGLSQEVVGEQYVLLTEGFELCEDGRLHHIALAKLCGKLTETYGREIEAFALSTAMAAQDPESFGIANMEASSKRGPRGKTMLTRGFGFEMYPGLRDWCEVNGYAGEANQDWIMAKFIDFATGRGDKQKDWPATFRTYSTNEIAHFRRYPPSVSTSPIGTHGELFAKPGGSSFASLQRNPHGLNKGDRAVAHNRALLNQDDVRPGMSARRASR